MLSSCIERSGVFASWLIQDQGGGGIKTPIGVIGDVFCYKILRASRIVKNLWFIVPLTSYKTQGTTYNYFVEAIDRVRNACKSCSPPAHDSQAFPVFCQHSAWETPAQHSGCRFVSLTYITGAKAEWHHANISRHSFDLVIYILT